MYLTDSLLYCSTSQDDKTLAGRTLDKILELFEHRLNFEGSDNLARLLAIEDHFRMLNVLHSGRRSCARLLGVLSNMIQVVVNESAKAQQQLRIPVLPMMFEDGTKFDRERYQSASDRDGWAKIKAETDAIFSILLPATEHFLQAGLESEAGLCSSELDVWGTRAANKPNEKPSVGGLCILLTEPGVSDKHRTRVLALFNHTLSKIRADQDRILVSHVLQKLPEHQLIGVVIGANPLGSTRSQYSPSTSISCR